jgi:hypothetical protein
VTPEEKGRAALKKRQAEYDIMPLKTHGARAEWL